MTAISFEAVFDHMNTDISRSVVWQPCLLQQQTRIKSCSIPLQQPLTLSICSCSLVQSSYQVKGAELVLSNAEQHRLEKPGGRCECTGPMLERWPTDLGVVRSVEAARDWLLTSNIASLFEYTSDRASKVRVADEATDKQSCKAASIREVRNYETTGATLLAGLHEFSGPTSQFSRIRNGRLPF